MATHQQPQMLVMDAAMLGITMCYAENCNNVATKHCDVLLCCQQYGCGRMMCELHKSKKKFGSRNYHPDVCLNCEKPASKCQWAICWCSCAIFILFIMMSFLIEALEISGETFGFD